MKKLILITFSVTLLLFFGCAESNESLKPQVPHPIQYYVLAKTGESSQKVLIPLDSIAVLNPGIRIVPPKIIKQESPKYPSIAVRAEITATVWLQIYVDTDGTVSKAIVLASDVELVNQSAVDASMKWKFSPLMVNEDPNKFIARYPISFQLPKGKPTVYLPI